MSFLSSIRTAATFLLGSEVPAAGRRRPSRVLGDAERLEPRLQLSVSVGMPVLNAKSDSGARDGITAITTPAFTGSVAKGTTAVLEITNVGTGAVSTLTAATGKGGAWKAAVPKAMALANGEYLVRAVQTAAGVDPVKSDPLSIRIDTGAPTLQSFTFDAATYTATLKFSAPVKGVTLKNFSISSDWFPGSISLADKRLKPLGVQVSPSTAAGSDTYTVSLGAADSVDAGLYAGLYTLRFDSKSVPIVVPQTGVKMAAVVQTVSAQLV